MHTQGQIPPLPALPGRRHKPQAEHSVTVTAARRDFIPGTSNLSLIPGSLPHGGAAARTADGSLVDESAAVHEAVPLSASLARTPVPRRWTHAPALGRDGRVPGRECRGACTTHRAHSVVRTRPGRVPLPDRAVPNRDRPDRSGRRRCRAWFLPLRFLLPA